jgi:hypothetical protein
MVWVCREVLDVILSCEFVGREELDVIVGREDLLVARACRFFFF